MADTVELDKGMGAAVRAAAPAVALAALALLPFLDKAYTVDDPYSLWAAEQILRDPRHPTAFDVVWLSAPERVTALVTPMAGYLLVPTVALGAPEWMAHLTWLLLLAWGVIATAALALRLGLGRRGARRAALFVVASPAVLGMASNSFPEIPALAFAAAGMAQLLAWRDEGRPLQGITAALWLTLACLSRPHVVLLVAVAAVALFPLERGIGWPAAVRRLAPVLAVPVALLAVFAVIADPFAGGPREIAQRFVVWFPRNPVAWVGHYALSMPLTLPWVGVRFRLLPWWVAAPAAAAGASLLFRTGELLGSSYMIPIAALTITVFADILRDGWRRGDHDQLVLWTWLLVPLPTLAYWHVAPKFLVPCAPAVALLLARALEQRGPRLAGWVTTVTATAGLALGVLIVAADARSAGLDRRAATELVAARTQRGETVWFAGHWGFHWYAERAGGRVLTRDSLPRAGDVVVSARHLPGAELADRVEPRQLVEVRRADAAAGRIMGKGAGFYSNGWGYLPWTWRRGELARFEVWRVGDRS